MPMNFGAKKVIKERKNLWKIMRKCKSKQEKNLKITKITMTF